VTTGDDMEISEFAFRVLLLFFPGIICSYIVDAFTIHKERNEFEFLINSFVYGMTTYLLYWIVVSSLPCLNINGGRVYFLQEMTDSKEPISIKELVNVCVVSAMLAIAITIMHTHKLHFRIAHKLKLTKKFGELDVWGYVMNSKNVTWVTVRDIDHNLAYDGWVQAFSDNSNDAEILLGDVVVYDNTNGNELYKVASQYLSMNKGNISIEVRQPG